jgi:hypothetical protein
VPLRGVADSDGAPDKMVMQLLPALPPALEAGVLPAFIF